MRPINNTKRSIRIRSTGRQGFTLLETLLAVAILLVLTIVVYQGFVSTMHVAANTAMFEQTGNIANSQANAALSGSSALTPSVGKVLLHSTGVTFDLSVDVNAYSAEPAPAGNFGGQSYVSAHRHVFTYKP